MEALIAVIAAAGILLFLSGLSVGETGQLARRVEPYLSGLHGKPSGLLMPARPPTRAARLLDRVLPPRGRQPRKDERLAERLSAAGLMKTPADFRLDQLLWGLAAMIGSWGLVLLSSSLGAHSDLRIIPVLGLVCFACGWLGRDWWLSKQIGRRRSLLREELPTAIDLVTLSIMAGESVPGAFERVAALLGSGIGVEFEMAVAEIRAGTPTLDALEFLKNRLPDTATVRFVDALCTGIERGAPLADVLRAQADDVRESRRQHLLEMGGRREIVMLLPVVFLILPVVVVFALWPGLASLDLLVP